MRKSVRRIPIAMLAVCLMVALSTQLAFAYKSSGNVYRKAADGQWRLTAGASVSIYCCDCNSYIGFDTSNLLGGYSIEDPSSCHNGHKMKIVANATVLGTYYKYEYVYWSSNSGVDETHHCWMEAETNFQIAPGLAFGLEPETFAVQEPYPVVAGFHILPDGEFAEVTDVDVYMSFDPDMMEFLNLEPIPPFDLYEYEIDNNLGTIHYQGWASNFTPVFVDPCVATLVLSGTVQPFLNRGVQSVSVVEVDSVLTNTSNGIADPIKVHTAFNMGPDPDIAIGMETEEYPIVVEPGGFFRYRGVLWNNTEETQQVDVWTMVNVPGHGLFGPLLRMNNVPVPPMQFIYAENVRQNIPGYAPEGVYDYIAYCGDFQSTLIDTCSFDFTVENADGFNTGDDWSADNWFHRTEPEQLPVTTVFANNYPNPFNAQTNIRFALPTQSHVELAVYNLAGQKVSTVVNRRMDAGYHAVAFDGSNMASGVYYYKLTAGEEIATGKMILLK